MGRGFMIGSSLLSTFLFILAFERGGNHHWISLALPLLLITLVIVNYLRFTRLVSWIIFSSGFFAFLVILSAFTLRWRLEPGFEPGPFYQAIIMYVAFIYCSLAQIKILGKPRQTES